MKYKGSEGKATIEVFVYDHGHSGMGNGEAYTGLSARASFPITILPACDNTCPSDLEVMQTFYADLDGPSWLENSNWMDGLPHAPLQPPTFDAPAFPWFMQPLLAVGWAIASVWLLPLVPVAACDSFRWCLLQAKNGQSSSTQPHNAGLSIPISLGSLWKNTPFTPF